MKKTSYILVILMIFLTLSACGGGGSAQTAAPTAKPEPLTDEEITQMYSDADSFKGRTVTIFGEVFGEVEQDKSGTYFQMWGDPANGERNTAVSYSGTDVSLSSGDYVKITGTVGGVSEGKNAFGATIKAVIITADSLELSNYIDAVSPTTKSVDINISQEQYGYKVTLDKIEFAKEETRVYLTVENGGSDNFSIYSFNTKIVQGGKQFEEQSNYEADYPEIQSDLVKGVTTEGIIAFPALELADMQLIIEGYSDNWQEDIEPYTFDVKISA